MADHRESEFVPGYLLTGEHAYFQAFRTRGYIADEFTVKHQVYLRNVRHAENAEQGQRARARVGLLHRFARRGLSNGFIVLHETRRQRPKAVAGFDRALAQQYLVAAG